MGRTKRRRKLKKKREYCSCNNSEELILLNAWLMKHGVRRNKNLGLAFFKKTGRGVLTKKKICAGDELINLPLNLTINVTTLILDTVFCNIFLENKKQCLIEYKQTVSFQSLMAFYLVYLKLLGTKSKWYIYLESLPKEYTVPYFLPSELRYYIDSEILSVITKQKEIIEKSFNIFENILNNNTSKNAVIDKLKEYFRKSVYEWAYFTVNTRCVFMDLTKVINLQEIHSSIIALISDNTKISLCPYLDMINHSPNAKNETKLVVSSDIKNISLNTIEEDVFTNVQFSIYTKNNFKPYTQVFICYGDSHNLKLITEYGFYLPSNDLDYVNFSFDDVKMFLHSKAINFSQDQSIFIMNHNLNKDLYIDFTGLSFNFYGLLMVAKYYYKENTDVSRLIYSAAICSSDRLLIDLIIPMVTEKLCHLKSSINKLNSFKDNCVVLNNCVQLMCQYVDILEKFIKC
ncbi:SET domain-containing protein 4 [Battus philenor]|uniref:SET domain-containing protein 4 n=1 Tax=Battus philenor TaxID=42288 RepID=UPI0035CE8A1B